MPSTDRGRDTSNALTHLRAVRTRAMDVRRRLDEPTEIAVRADGSQDYLAPRVEDPDAVEMRAALDEVIRVLAPWARTGRQRP
jgi:hypothetical protein